MAKKAIPTYEMLLKSNEELIEPPKVFRLSENETANVECSIYDSGFDQNSLSIMINGKKNERNVSKNNNSIIYQIKNYQNTDMNFECSAKRKNGKYQTRKMKVAPRLTREINDDEIPCSTNKCVNNGLCVKSTSSNIELCLYVIALTN